MRLLTGAIKTCIWAVKGAYELTAGVLKLVYKIGEYTFEVVRAPREATLTHEEIDSMDGLPVKEAIRLGSGDRIIDLSMGAAKQLGFYEKGTAMVKVEAVQLKEDD